VAVRQPATDTIVAPAGSAPQDAGVAWKGAGFDLTDEQPGRTVDRGAAVAGLTAALDAAAPPVIRPGVESPDGHRDHPLGPG